MSDIHLVIGPSVCRRLPIISFVFLRTLRPETDSGKLISVEANWPSHLPYEGWILTIQMFTDRTNISTLTQGTSLSFSWNPARLLDALCRGQTEKTLAAPGGSLGFPGRLC